MKHMQDFREWLSSTNAASTADQRRLAALTRLSRAQLSNVAANLTWFFWSTENSAAAS